MKVTLTLTGPIAIEVPLGTSLGSSSIALTDAAGVSQTVTIPAGSVDGDVPGDVAAGPATYVLTNMDTAGATLGTPLSGTLDIQPTAIMLSVPGAVAVTSAV